MSAGLAASTVTPGRIAPDESFTVPAMLAWAYAVAGIDEIKRIQQANRGNFASTRIFGTSRSWTNVPGPRRVGGRERMSGPDDTPGEQFYGRSRRIEFNIWPAEPPLHSPH